MPLGRAITQGECSTSARCWSYSTINSINECGRMQHRLILPTRRRPRLVMLSSTNDSVPPEKQAILDRINKAKAYRQGTGPATPTSSSPAAAPPPAAPKQPDWRAMTAFLGGAEAQEPPPAQQRQVLGSTAAPSLPTDPQLQQRWVQEQREAEAERQRRCEGRGAPQ